MSADYKSYAEHEGTGLQRTFEEISAAIFVIEKEAKGLLAGIIGGRKR